MSIQLTSGSHELFAALIEDAGNWSGQPLIGGNVEMTKARKGNLSDLVKKGLLEVIDDGEGHTYAKFTTAGIDYAKEHGLPDADWLAVELGFTTEEAVETVAAIYENGLEMNPAEGEAYEAPLEAEEEGDEGPAIFIPAAHADKDAQIRAVAARLASEVFQETEGGNEPKAPAQEAPKPAKAKAAPREKLVLTDLNGTEVASRRAPNLDTMALVLDLVGGFGGGVATPFEKLHEAGFDADTLDRIRRRIKSWFGKDRVAQTKEGLVINLRVREEGPEAAQTAEAGEIA